MRNRNTRILALAAFLFLTILALYSKKLEKNTITQISNKRIAPVNSSKNHILNAEKCATAVLVGEWESESDGKILSFEKDCRFKNESCESFGRFDIEGSSNAGKLFLDIESEISSNKNCPPGKKSECFFQLDKTNEPFDLTIDCNKKKQKYKHSTNHKNVLVKEDKKIEKIQNEGMAPDVAEDLVSKEHESPIKKKSEQEKQIRANACDGIFRKGARRCYYNNLPTVLTTGETYGQNVWSSLNLNPKFQQQFIAENNFSVRVIARKNINGTSLDGKKCNPKLFKASKIQVHLSLRREDAEKGEVATLVSGIDSPSDVWHFTIPHAIEQSYILEVKEVNTNSLCISDAGARLASCKQRSFAKLIDSYPNAPVRECAAFDIQFATERTYELPGRKAN